MEVYAFCSDKLVVETNIKDVL